MDPYHDVDSPAERERREKQRTSIAALYATIDYEAIRRGIKRANAKHAAAQGDTKRFAERLYGEKK